MNDEALRQLFRSLDEAALQWLFQRALDRKQLQQLVEHTLGGPAANGEPAALPPEHTAEAAEFLHRLLSSHSGPVTLPAEPGSEPEAASGNPLSLLASAQPLFSSLLPNSFLSMLADDDRDIEIERENTISFTPKRRSGDEDEADDTSDAYLVQAGDGQSISLRDETTGQVTVGKRELIKIRRKEKKELQKVEKVREEVSHLKAAAATFKKEKTQLLDELAEARRQTDALRRQADETVRVRQLLALREQSLSQAEQERADLAQKLGSLTGQEDEIRRLHERIHYMEEEQVTLRSTLLHTFEEVIREREELVGKLNRTREEVVSSLHRLTSERNLLVDSSRRARQVNAPRVGLFVDVQNMFYAARKRFNGKLNYQELIPYTIRDRHMAKAVAYIIQTPDVDQTSFIALLERCGYKVRSKELKTRLDGSAKGDWDMDIAMDIISSIQQLDIVVLVSGDGDFVPLVKMLKKHGLGVEVASFEYNTAMELREIADVFMPITEHLILEQ